MVKWKYCLVLALLLLLPARIGSKRDEEDDDDRNDDEEDEDDNDDDSEDDDPGGENPAPVVQGPVRRTAASVLTTRSVVVTRTTKKHPLECYVCAYKADTPLRACLDPTKYKVHTMTCHSLDDKCFTSVLSKGSSFEAVVRGCRSACVGTPEITCCELNRCNHQAFAMPTMAARVLVQQNKATKPLHPSVLFFVTILLVLQTVVKVSFV